VELACLHGQIAQRTIHHRAGKLSESTGTTAVATDYVLVEDLSSIKASHSPISSWCESAVDEFPLVDPQSGWMKDE